MVDRFSEIQKSKEEAAMPFMTLSLKSHSINSTILSLSHSLSHSFVVGGDFTQGHKYLKTKIMGPFWNPTIAVSDWIWLVFNNAVTLAT